MDTSQTEPKDPEIIPLAKTDWIRFGALKVQAKSKRVWQVAAIIAIVGIVVITATDGWLFMERKIRTQEIRHQMESLANQNKTLALRLSSLKSAIKEYNRLISMATNEKNQLAVEKGILQAQTELLMSQIEALEASIKAPAVEPEQQPDEQQPTGSALTPQGSEPPQMSEPSRVLPAPEALELSYVPVK